MWQPRWALVGDSIQAWVLEAGGLSTVGKGKDLTASRIPQLVNTSIQNLSLPGMRLAKGVGTDEYVFDPAFLKKISGGFGINGVICTLGTNDYGSPDVTTVDMFHAVAALGDYVKTNLNVPLVFVSPIWRQDQNNLVAKYNGTSSPLADFQNTIQWVASLFPPESNVHFIDGKTCPVWDASYFGGDGLHLNAKGHLAFSNWLVDQMKAKGFWQNY